MTRADEANEREQELSRLTGKPAKSIAYPDPGGGFGFNHTLAPHASCPECHGEGVMRVLVRDSENLSPAGLALYGGVKQTANGLEVKMADQQKAAEIVGKILGAFKDDSPKKLQVEIAGMAAIVRTEAKDPQEAARMYQDMIAGKLS
jgi:phage terminase small subunit